MKYMASDGMVFDLEDACKEHEATILLLDQKEALIEEHCQWLADQGKNMGKRNKTVVTNVIRDWERWLLIKDSPS